jgi:hypothetical protein
MTEDTGQFIPIVELHPESRKSEESIERGPWSEENPNIIMIGASLGPEERARFAQFLSRYRDVFAWSYNDMPGLDPVLVEHNFNIGLKRKSPSSIPTWSFQRKNEKWPAELGLGLF